MDQESERAKTVYATFGLALYFAQCVERSLAILLATKYGPGPTKITRAQYDELLQKMFDKTFGGLAKHLRETVGIPAEFEATLNEAINKRNWLAHHYFWGRAGHFVTEEGCIFMISELEEIVNFFITFEQQLDEIIRKYMSQRGLTEELLLSVEEQIQARACEHVNDT